MSIKLVLYGLITIASTAGIISSAFRNYSNVYAVVVYLSNSNGASLILGNFLLFTALCIGKAIQKLLFGELRTLEIEHLYEKSWYGFTEMILAMTMFRDEFDVGGASFLRTHTLTYHKQLFYGLMFGFLFFVKVFHWLTHDRIEYVCRCAGLRPYAKRPQMVQYQIASRLFIARMSAVLIGLFIADMALLSISVLDIYINGVTMIILFASEYAILVADVISYSIVFAVNLIDLRSEQAWEDKSLYLLYIDIFTEFLKLCIYTPFFFVVVASFGFPLNLIRDLFLTARVFAMKIKDLQRYKTASQNMDRLYKAATVAELDALSDKLCIICRDDLVHASQHPGPWPSGLDETPKKLPCAHIFHRHCLKSWLERQQTCPTCRTSVIPNPQSGFNNRPRNNPVGNDPPRPDPRRDNNRHDAVRTQTEAQTNDEAQGSTNEAPASQNTANQNRQPSSPSTRPSRPFSTTTPSEGMQQQHPMSQILNIPDVTLPIIRPESRTVPSTYWRDAYKNARNSASSHIPSIGTSGESNKAPTAENIPLPPSPTTSSQENLNIDARLSSILDAQSSMNKAIEDLVDIVKDTNKRERRCSDGDKTSQQDADSKRARIS
ncbi:hypothetical protein E3P92_00930 [Wallemia ichthyophaga]|uniref:RING-type E3 ubiquitin transferase n=1 Tax=Wallemia ichthyophaga TaxID=245174 RepID=A0A4T0GPA1_WALIC|nr:hypothetical protein E3P91_00665 [Wallemia ichthyophaga]TIA83657.1 hypothetical protein E3P98_00657 [Wallemia ichthyophaga]TIB02667.1 hypothetical protein E3P95_00883 [Wallemia ichthyophaga]TIB03646.1 hypothetical protein E3P94_01015 [Wallemia ichthyophaga]TIB05847.1 hypothetical protein E3P96_00840 [Wallemia ichthyophaga]